MPLLIPLNWRHDISTNSGLAIVYPYVDTPVIENPIGASTVYADVGFSWNATCTSPDNGTTADWARTQRSHVDCGRRGRGGLFGCIRHSRFWRCRLVLSESQRVRWQFDGLFGRDARRPESNADIVGVARGVGLRRRPIRLNATCSAPNDGATDWALHTNATFLSISDGGDGHDYCNVSRARRPPDVLRQPVGVR